MKQETFDPYTDTITYKEQESNGRGERKPTVLTLGRGVKIYKATLTTGVEAVVVARNFQSAVNHVDRELDGNLVSLVQVD